VISSSVARRRKYADAGDRGRGQPEVLRFEDLPTGELESRRAVVGSSDGT
jgi:hypothetical protein